MKLNTIEKKRLELNIKKFEINIEEEEFKKIELEEKMRLNFNNIDKHIVILKEEIEKAKTRLEESKEQANEQPQIEKSYKKKQD